MYLLFGYAGRFYLQLQPKEFSRYFQNLSVYIHKWNSNVSFFCTSSKYFGMSIKAGCMLAGVISYQPGWLVLLAISLWSVLTTRCQHCQVHCITFVALGIPLIWSVKVLHILIEQSFLFQWKSSNRTHVECSRTI